MGIATLGVQLQLGRGSMIRYGTCTRIWLDSIQFIYSCSEWKTRRALTRNAARNMTVGSRSKRTPTSPVPAPYRSGRSTREIAPLVGREVNVGGLNKSNDSGSHFCHWFQLMTRLVTACLSYVLPVAVFASGQSVQSTVVPRLPSPVGEWSKVRLQSYRP